MSGGAGISSGGGSFFSGLVTETPSPSANGVVSLFSVSQSYKSNSLQLYYNGQRLASGISNDYVETPTTGEFTFTFTPSAGANLLATYVPSNLAATTYVYGENCSNQIVSGGEINFTTANSFNGNSLEVYYNGLRLKQTDDYVISGSSAFTFTFSSSAGSNLIVDYDSLQTQLNAYTIYSTSDIEVLDYTKGIILHSPSGARYRITVNNSGTLTTTLAT